MFGQKENGKFVCYDCFRLKECKEPLVSWLFFFIALLAVISLRAVNLVIDFNPLWAKIFWYIGIIGFLFFFLYKYRYDSLLQEELKGNQISNKLLAKSKLSDHDYEVLGTVICKLSSNKDRINYFFIFFFSAIALILGLYTDLIRK